MKNILKIVFFIAIGILCSCSNDDENNTNVIKIGDEHQGGIVYYIFKEEDKGFIAGETHGLIASYEEISAADDEYFWWYCFEDVSNPFSPIPSYDNLELIGATGEDIGDGKENTLKIINYCSNTGGVLTMAYICDNYQIDYDGVIYDDWFLPSRFEVAVMVAIDEDPNNNALGLKHGDGYPSSTELNAVSYYAVQRWVDQCGESFFDACAHPRLYEEFKGSWASWVRPIRYF
ncbi:hypothetical protein [Aquimarina latercula]|uniref:hypothetical protein n=1 Tax=Aquimarina latercula TaxID=987 RepID=UPI00041A5880|nr:hypothetical protein [Aquimarina latercula]